MYYEYPDKNSSKDPQLYPALDVIIQMGDNKSIYKRQAYTILSLLGDFGGFVDALVLLLGLFARFYGAKMFLASISSELPYAE